MRTIAAIIPILFAGITANAQGLIDTVPTLPVANARQRFFGDFNMGISNYGMAGDLMMYYRTGNRFISAGYYQSHVCYTGDYNGIPFWRSGGTTHHVSIFSFSAAYGFMLPSSKWKQGLSAGISLSRIKDETTEPVHNDFSLGGVYREIAGDGFEHHSHGSEVMLVVGLPIEYKVFLLNKGWIGLDMAARVDLNLTMIFSAITVGLRVGK